MPHFEIHVDDVERAKKFYGGLFGWKFIPMEMEGDAAEVQYHVIDAPYFKNEAGALSGGMMRRMGEAAPKGSPVRGGTMTFEVEDCDDRYEWALANGGSEALPPMDYPGIGRAAYVEDGEGNIVGMIASLDGDAHGD